MKKILIGLFVILFVMSAFSVSAAAQSRNAGTSVTIDLRDLDDFTRNSVMKKMKEREEGAKGIMESVDPVAARAWAQVVTDTIKDICHNLNVEVNDFIKTPVGMIVAGTIVYKVAGRDIFLALKNVVLGTVGWFLTLFIIYFVARKFVIPRKIKVTKTWNDKDKGKVTEVDYHFKVPYEFRQSSDSKAVAVGFLVGTSIASTIAAMIIVL